MFRKLIPFIYLVVVVLLSPFSARAEPFKGQQIKGYYLETRTCQVYTGPCFANGEVGLAGKDAIMAWSIAEGEHDGVDLAGLNVVVVLNANNTLGFNGLKDASKLKSIILVDEKATGEKRDALISFAKKHAGEAGKSVVRIDSAPIEMEVDFAEFSSKLKAGKQVKVTTRKAHKGDCICSNESNYYPPLANVEFFAPGVTLEGEFKGRGLGTRWSTPDSRSSYLGVFKYSN